MFPQNKRKKAVKAALAAAVLLPMAGFSAYVFWGGHQAVVAPQSHPPVSGAPPEGGDAAGLMPAGPVQAQDENLGKYLNLPAGNMQRLTELQAELREKSLVVSIEEENAKLRRLLENDSSSLPRAVPPSFSAPARPTVPSENLNSSWPRVLSIQGLDGNIAATVNTASGLQIIRVGDTLAGGRVERISSEGVHIRDGEAARLYSVEE